MCNFIFKHPNALLRSQLIATREQLDRNETNHHQPLFNEVADLFNDPKENSGGIVQEHPAFSEAKVNPETINRGKITPEKVFEIWKKTVRLYAKVIPNFSKSGLNNGHDFWTYCYDTDVYYLYLILQKYGNSDLKSFCAEGYSIKGGVESFVFEPPTEENDDEELQGNHSSNSLFLFD